MDWAAGHFFDTWTQRTDHPLAAAARYHGQRRANLTSHGLEGWARETGWRAAEQLCRLAETSTNDLQYLGVWGLQARTVVAQLATLINSSKIERCSKDVLVRQLDSHDLSSGVETALRSWLRRVGGVDEILGACRDSV